MNEHLFGFISSIVAGIVTNGIQGVSHYITKETLQDHIANTIGAVQLLYEKKFDFYYIIFICFINANINNFCLLANYKGCYNWFRFATCFKHNFFLLFKK